MNQGFTLIELLVVVLIIDVLSAVALPQYQSAVERSRATEALTLMAAVSDALQRYHAQHEDWPANNAFSKLDVDIPSYTSNDSTVYGGKNFTLTFTSDSTNNTSQVVAERKRNTNSYTLYTIITANDNGTYSTKRCCMPESTTSNSEAQSYCDAISGGHSSCTGSGF